eukprot:TRINITY_DN2386_c0_g1_i1.p1 TRINITY_DN2386_c0_g1~~TRINITY_DN2386_c0_g1_i1.p1  ORF type:complete len:151 (-),score=0.44 TRINITY_DN2386_c0_g1_i1:1-453(-)
MNQKVLQRTCYKSRFADNIFVSHDQYNNCINTNSTTFFKLDLNQLGVRVGQGFKQQIDGGHSYRQFLLFSFCFQNWRWGGVKKTGIVRFYRVGRRFWENVNRVLQQNLKTLLLGRVAFILVVAIWGAILAPPKISKCLVNSKFSQFISQF